MNKEDLEVGQEVREFDVNDRGTNPVGQPGTITKIGRTLVTVKFNGWRGEQKYRIEDGYETGDYRHSHIEAIPEMDARVRREAVTSALREHGLVPVGYGGFKQSTKVLELLLAVLADEVTP